MLDNGSSMPLYEQLYVQIINRINNKELLPGDVLPGERRLSEMYNVSRVTIRQAINQLINDGYLKSVQGKGTYVLKRKIQNRLGSLIGVAEELANEFESIRIKVLSHEESIPEAYIAKHLSIGVDEKVFKLVRLISIDQEPIVLNQAYLNTSFRHIYELLDLRKDIIYYALERFGYKIVDADQTIKAAKPEYNEVEPLCIQKDDSVLVIERTTFLENKSPIIYEKSVYRSDMYEYSINLRRNYRGA